MLIPILSLMGPSFAAGEAAAAMSGAGNMSGAQVTDISASPWALATGDQELLHLLLVRVRQKPSRAVPFLDLLSDPHGHLDGRDPETDNRSRYAAKIAVAIMKTSKTGEKYVLGDAAFFEDGCICSHEASGLLYRGRVGRGSPARGVSASIL